MTPHRITSSPCSFISFPCFYGNTWHVFEILRRLFWGAYLHNYVSEFMKKCPFPPVESWHACRMSSSRNFLLRYAPDCTFSSRKMKKLPIVGGETPPSHTLPPLPRFAPRKDWAPIFFLAHYATVDSDTENNFLIEIHCARAIALPLALTCEAKLVCEQANFSDAHTWNYWSVSYNVVSSIITKVMI